MRAIDPVCGMSVEPTEAWAKLAHNGTVYHFCGNSCAKAFAEDPERYATKPAAKTQEHHGCCGGKGHHHGEHANHGHHGHHGHGCCRH